MRRDPQAHGVDQAVLLVRTLEVDLAAHRRHADRVAVVADAGDDAVQQIARTCRVELAEAQRVQHRDRACTYSEDVAQDPADARGRPLERFNRARMVVRLNLEGDRQPVAHVDRAGVLAGAQEQVRTLGRKPAQQLLRVLVAAVLGPHEREDGQLDVVGLAAELLADLLVLVVGQAELRVLRARADHAGTHAIDWKSFPPSAEPTSGSTACSGWGMSPTTLPASLATPAMSANDPFGFCPGA